MSLTFDMDAFHDSPRLIFQINQTMMDPLNITSHLVQEAGMISQTSDNSQPTYAKKGRITTQAEPDWPNG